MFRQGTSFVAGAWKTGFFFLASGLSLTAAGCRFAGAPVSPEYLVGGAIMMIAGTAVLGHALETHVGRRNDGRPNPSDGWDICARRI
jgi:hypothetical protein